MHGLTKGIIMGIGGIAGAAGLAYMMSETHTRDRLMKSGKKMIHKAENMAERIDVF